jgi:hypothetical protein
MILRHVAIVARPVVPTTASKQVQAKVFQKSQTIIRRKNWCGLALRLMQQLRCSMQASLFTKVETMTQFTPFDGETTFTHAGDFLLESVLEPLPPVMIELPVIQIPRAARRMYSDSELSTAAVMLAKLKGGTDRASRQGVVQDEVLETVVEKLMRKLD